MHSRSHGGRGVDPREKPTGGALSVDEFLTGVLLPLFDAAARGAPPEPGGDLLDPSLPPATSFIFDERESARNMIAQLCQDCPTIASSRDTFLAHAAEMYDSLLQQ